MSLYVIICETTLHLQSCILSKESYSCLAWHCLQTGWESHHLLLQGHGARTTRLHELWEKGQGKIMMTRETGLISGQDKRVIYNLDTRTHIYKFVSDQSALPRIELPPHAMPLSQEQHYFIIIWQYRVISRCDMYFVVARQCLTLLVFEYINSGQVTMVSATKRWRNSCNVFSRWLKPFFVWVEMMTKRRNHLPLMLQYCLGPAWLSISKECYFILDNNNNRLTINN